MGYAHKVSKEPERDDSRTVPKNPNKGAYRRQSS